MDAKIAIVYYLEMDYNINGIKIYYELLGQGKPIVLIAGFSCDHTFWSNIVAELAQRHQVLLLDNRGIGRTDSPDSAYSVDLMADDVMALMKALGIKQPTIVGQSMGSAITQSIGRRYSKDIHKLVLMNTFDKINKTSDIVFTLTGELQRMNVPLKYRVQTIVPWVFSNEFLSQPNQLSNLIQLAENNPYPQTLVGYERQLAALKQFNSRAWLHEINIPTLIIAGKEDIIAPLADAQAVAQAMGIKTLEILPGGHATPIEQPQKTTQAILEFIH
jgi:pimeloyl-ACP methyl ester carboxylesterase